MCLLDQNPLRFKDYFPFGRFMEFKSNKNGPHNNLFVYFCTNEISPYCANTSETDPEVHFFIQRMPLKFGGGPKCKRCGKTVYKAEEVISEAGIFHKQCFRCSSCNKVPDEQSSCEIASFIFIYI